MSDENKKPEEEEEKGPDETLEIKGPSGTETSRLERRKKLTLQDSKGQESGEVAPGDTSPGESSNQPAVVDPTRRRETNTAKLRRLKAEGIEQDDPDNTDTVNIKVIKEQKRQFKNMMTSSQTLRVKPSDEGESEEAAPKEGESSKRTLKIKAPTDAQTQNISRPSAPAAPTQQAPAASSSPKSTLKIKAPAGVAPAQGGGGAAQKPGGTLKARNKTKEQNFEVKHSLTSRQIDVVLKGSLIKLMREKKAES